MICRVIYAFILLAVLSCKNENTELIQKIKNMPSFNVLELDSTTIFNTSQLTNGKSTIIIYFDPDCETCQQETNLIKSNIDLLSATNILMLSIRNTSRLKEFVAEYNINHYPNIKVAKDIKYSMLNIFKLQSIPSSIFYDKNKIIQKIYEGSFSKEEMTEILNL